MNPTPKESDSGHAVCTRYIERWCIVGKQKDKQHADKQGGKMVACGEGGCPSQIRFSLARNKENQGSALSCCSVRYCLSCVRNVSPIPLLPCCFCLGCVAGQWIPFCKESRSLWGWKLDSLSRTNTTMGDDVTAAFLKRANSSSAAVASLTLVHVSW